MAASAAAQGTAVALWRYPVKSMQGEELNAAVVTARGLAGDRAYALVDRNSGRVAGAKNPRKWPTLLAYRAALLDEPMGAAIGPVRITLPDGTVVRGDQPDVDAVLSRALQHRVTLQAAASPSPAPREAEKYWPDLAGLDYRDTVTEFALPEGTFFDAAAVHLLTTGTLDRLRTLYPAGRFEARRFRPNVVAATLADAPEFPEAAWVGRTLALGDTVRLEIVAPCPRCVVTTAAQSDLPADLGILRAAAEHHAAEVGVYGAVRQGGTMRRGDVVRLL